MKKWFFLVVFILSALVLTACSASEEPFTRQEYSVKADEVSQVSIDVRDRQIQVRVSPDDQIRIEYFDNSKEFYEIAVSGDKALTMTAKNDKAWSDYVGLKDSGMAKIEVWVPEGALDSLSLFTTNETISLEPLSVSGSVQLTANGGDLVFSKLDAGKSVVLSGKNGNISGTILGGYDDFAISCEGKKGKSNLPEEKKGGEKTLSVSYNNGDVAVEFVPSADKG